MDITTPHLRYTSQGHYGTISFISDETSFDISWEFAGGDAVAILFIPSIQHWEAQTKTALTQRAGILQFIGEQVLKDRMNGKGYFLVHDNWLTLYTGQKSTG